MPRNGNAKLLPVSSSKDPPRAPRMQVEVDLSAASCVQRDPMRLPMLFLLASLAACTRPLDEPITAVETENEAKAPSPSASAPASPAPSAEASASPPSAAETPAERDARFVPALAAAFREYKAWGRVDDELRWAPWLCRMPLPGRTRMSEAVAEGDHARKLYSVFAKQRDRYPMHQNAPRVAQPVGQLLVKESYHPDPVDKVEPDPVAGGNLVEGDHFDRHARHGGRLYRATRLAGAYVVLKLAKETPGTDEGWVYGTVTPEGEVTSAGRVASCMGCHVSAPHERVFGLGPSASVDF
jgi:hypothetical protein